MRSILFETRRHLARTAVWRTKLGEKFPHDVRNRLANQLLSKLVLASDAEVSEATLTALKPYEDTGLLNSALQAETKLVGFVTNPETLDEFLQGVLDYINGKADGPPPAGATLATVLPTAVAAR